ncbi:FadR family transcriptional regulator [Paenibacillus albidus]|uniref:FadR/GntR family transcriptional regulator n=1 Tax=Paenibacillus albidus TaxID=2041023 RepID=UPI001BEC4A22|nr:FCD domain-containing protein [Paenibacillus albidus]MBT2290541.1 FadR family transcriptional regulator [Paenibacillus albidus]
MFIRFPLNLEKVSAKKVSEFIREQLEEAIILKELLSEEQLPSERELAEIFNASRITVREALSQLESKGLIEKRVGAKGGTFVLPVTANSHKRTRAEIKRDWEQMLKVFEYRTIIEPEGACLAAERITAGELELLQSYLDKSMEPECTREWFRALDVKFHLTIAKASGNPYCEAAVRQIRTKINPALDLMPYDEEIRAVNYGIHSEILTALKARDREQSREIMRRHIGNSGEAIYARLVAKG